MEVVVYVDFYNKVVGLTDEIVKKTRESVEFKAFFADNWESFLTLIDSDTHSKEELRKIELTKDYEQLTEEEREKVIRVVIDEWIGCFYTCFRFEVRGLTRGFPCHARAVLCILTIDTTLVLCYTYIRK